MGCPPDPLDQEYARLEEQRAHRERQTANARAELVVALALTEALVAGQASAEFVERARLLREQAAALPASHPERRLDWAAQASDVSSTSSMQFEYDAVVQVGKQVELALCETRQLLLEVARATGQLARADVEQQRRFHLVHRHEDRAAYLRALASARQFATSKERRQQLDAERRRVEALTDEALLADRRLFFEVPAHG